MERTGGIETPASNAYDRAVKPLVDLFLQHHTWEGTFSSALFSLDEGSSTLTSVKTPQALNI